MTKEFLEIVRNFAEYNWCAEDIDDSSQLYVESKGMAVTNPWIDYSGRFPLTDEGAIKEWGADAVREFCDKVRDAMGLTVEEANAVYTGGNIWLFHGKMNDGNFFLMSDDGYLLILNANPAEDFEKCCWSDWQDEHLVRELFNHTGRKEVISQIIDYLLNNDNDEHSGGITNGELERYRNYFLKGEDMIIGEKNEDGIVFITGEEHKYLVFYNIDGELVTPAIKTAMEIFKEMDMSDCYDIYIKKLILLDGDELIECRFYGVWHDMKEKLKMKIANAVTGEVYDVGYGTDH